MSRTRLRLALSISFWVLLTYPVIQVLWIMITTHAVNPRFDIPAILFGVLGYETYRRIALRPAGSFAANLGKAALLGLLLSLFCGVVTSLLVVSLAGLLGHGGEFRAYINQRPVRDPYIFIEAAVLNAALFPLALWITSKLLPLEEATSFFTKLETEKKSRRLQRKEARRSAKETRAALQVQKKQIMEQRRVREEAPQLTESQSRAAVPDSRPVVKQKQQSEDEGRRTPIELVVSVFIALSVCAFQAADPFGRSYASDYWAARSAWMATWFFVAAYFVIAGLAFTHLNRRSLSVGACLGAASSTLVLFAPVAASAFVGIVFMGDPRVAGLYFTRVLMLGIAPLFIAIIFLVVRRKTEPLEFKTVIAAAALLWVPWIATEAIREHEKSEVERAVIDAREEPREMNRVAACLVRYYSSNHAFPNSMQQLESTLPACLQSQSAKGRFVAGYRYRYEIGADGQSYSLTAEPQHAPGEFAISFFSDETTIIRRHDNDLLLHSDKPEHRMANASDRVDGQLLETISRYANRISDFNYDAHRGEKERWQRSYNPDELTYPLTLVELRPTYMDQDSRFADDNTLEASGYRITYTPAPHAPTGFELHARPLEYGRTGVASFIVDVTGVVHTSTEDRDASLEDRALCGFAISSCLSRSLPRAPKYDLYMPGPHTDNNTHPGGISADSHPKVFWVQEMTTVGPKVVAASNDRVYATHGHWLVAVGFDGNPIWKTPEPSQTFGLADRVILKYGATVNQYTADGTLEWSFNGGEGGKAIRSKSGITFVPGPFTYAISPEGKLLWRRRDPENQKEITLSSDEGTLLLRSDERLQAIDATTGNKIWEVPMQSQFTGWNLPLFLSDGSVVVASSGKTSKYDDPWNLFLLDRQGKTLWSRSIAANTKYQVLAGTDQIVLIENGFVYGMDKSEHELWRFDGRAGISTATSQALPEALKRYGGVLWTRQGDMYVVALRDRNATPSNISPPYWVAILDHDLNEVTRFGPISIRYFLGADCCGVFPTPDHKILFITSDQVAFTVRWPKDLPPQPLK